MASGLFRRMSILSVVAAVAMLAAGCGGADSGEEETSGEANPVAAEPAVDDHSGWWCAGHGVPEEECSMCSATAAEAFKAKGDWCDEHNRAESQCFLCDPGRAVKFAALYKAKFGEEPPAMPE